MTSLITRCPKCSTAFNVTDAHLNTANGAVRCGSCLNVFNGRENLTNSLQKSSSRALLDDDDDLLISDDLELDELRDAPPEVDPSTERVKSILEKVEEQSATEVDDDESWALQLLEDEGHNPSQLGLNKKPASETTPEEPPAEAITPSEPEAEAEPTPEAEPNKANQKSEHLQPTHNEQKDASVARSALLDETAPSNTAISDKESEGSPTNKEQAASEEPTAAAKKAKEYAASKAEEPEPEVEIAEKDFAELQQELDAAKQANDSGPQAPRTLVDAIEVEAVELQYTAKRPVWLSRMIWLVLAVCAGAALAAQIAWLKFDELSIKDPYRQYYAIACEHIGCELPIRKNLRKIRTTNLLVRTHPSTEGALLVDVVIQNHALYEQPFPKLVLIFSNIKNKVVASRAFEPSEYLGGDLTGASMMPSLKAIHLSLELVDPGKGAVSYKIVIDE